MVRFKRSEDQICGCLGLWTGIKKGNQCMAISYTTSHVSLLIVHRTLVGKSRVLAYAWFFWISTWPSWQTLNYTTYSLAYLRNVWKNFWNLAIQLKKKAAKNWCSACLVNAVEVFLMKNTSNRFFSLYVFILNLVVQGI